MKFKKRPVVVDAFVYDGDLKSGIEPEWAMDAFGRGVLFYDSLYGNTPPCDLFLETKTNRVFVDIGDYIVRYPDGELKAYMPEIFKEKFDSVVELQ